MGGGNPLLFCFAIFFVGPLTSGTAHRVALFAFMNLRFRVIHVSFFDCIYIFRGVNRATGGKALQPPT